MSAAGQAFPHDNSMSSVCSPKPPSSSPLPPVLSSESAPAPPTNRLSLFGGIAGTQHLLELDRRTAACFARHGIDPNYRSSHDEPIEGEGRHQNLPYRAPRRNVTVTYSERPIPREIMHHPFVPPSYSCTYGQLCIGYFNYNSNDPATSLIPTQVFEMKDTPRDGDCLFTSIASFLPQNVTAAVVRERTCKFLQENPTAPVYHLGPLKSFVESSVYCKQWPNINSFDEYVIEMRKATHFGTEIEIIVASMIFCKRIQLWESVGPDPRER